MQGNRKQPTDTGPRWPSPHCAETACYRHPIRPPLRAVEEAIAAQSDATRISYIRATRRNGKFLWRRGIRNAFVDIFLSVLHQSGIQMTIYSFRKTLQIDELSRVQNNKSTQKSRNPLSLPKQLCVFSLGLSRGWCFVILLPETKKTSLGPRLCISSSQPTIQD